MSSIFSVNIGLEEPANGDYNNDWNLPVNANSTLVDQALGSSTSVAVSNADVTLTVAQAAFLTINLSGTLTANVSLIFPSIGGVRYINNTVTKGSFGVTIKNSVSDAGVSVPYGTVSMIILNGANALTSPLQFTKNGIFAQSPVINDPTIACTSSSPVTISGLSNPLAVTHFINAGVGINFYSGAVSGTQTAALFTFGTFFSQFTAGSITYTTTATSYNTSSDARLKDDVKPISRALSIIDKLNPVSFKWIRTPRARRAHGFIAQDLHKVYPEAVTRGGDDPQTNPWVVDKSTLIPILVAAIQELKAEIVALKARRV